MDNFIKTTEPKYSGIEKAAILLGELGMEGSADVLKYLNLSDYEKSKIEKMLKRLGKYNPNDMRQVRREQSVLEEALEFGRKHNILSSKPTKTAVANENRVNDIIKQNPDSIAKILGAWMKADD